MIYPLPNKDYKVLVVTFTYNQEKYIDRALDGILMQQTNFPFVALVLDDCSTDTTASIVREYESKYPDKIKGIYQQENFTSQGKSQEEFIHPWQLRSKYEAFCEGDDYWTDPLKLQKQVDFMENHPDCTMSFHNVIEHWEDGSSEDKKFYDIENRIYSGEEILQNWIISTSSTMFRTDITSIPEMQKIILTKGFMYYDIVLFLACGMYGSLMGMNETMSVYRRLNNGYTINFQSKLSDSKDLLWKYCLHNHNLAITFAPHYGAQLRSIAINRFTNNIYKGIKLCVKEKDFKGVLFFLKQSFAYYPKETFKAFLRKIF